MLHKQFENYLSSTGISFKSLKNYKSDISHFLAWAILKLKTFGSYVEGLDELVPFLTNAFAVEYRNYMGENSTPPKTLNRRLSTLRHLAKFLISSQIADFDFMEGIQNMGVSQRKGKTSPSLVEDFTIHLQAQNVSKNTIKNYASDVRQFLAWLEEKEYAHSA